ncbi:MAG: hypothetical protein CBD66_000820 [Flavobacteriaceae bacterium TMED206]|nr:MAG: hypothetical protein CBD66_000820 [Flavobacteriaceae bacterium TMED206]|tara:strand:+ start:9639 stop:10082 length:444 start_codon:yes stop_codon:yes gene_type:complete
MLKKHVIEYILSVLRSNTDLLENELKSINDEKNSITKSSAGDKHETSRALMQSEFDKINNNYQSQLNQLKVIESLDISDKSKIGLGSLVETDSSILFIGIGLGIHQIDNKKVLIVSKASPIGKQIDGKEEGDYILLNNNKEKIIRIS